MIDTFPLRIAADPARRAGETWDGSLTNTARSLFLETTRFTPPGTLKTSAARGWLRRATATAGQSVPLFLREGVTGPRGPRDSLAAPRRSCRCQPRPPPHHAL